MRPPGLVVYCRRQHHVAGAWPQFKFVPRHAGRPTREAEPQPMFSQLHHSSGDLHTRVFRPGSTDEVAGEVAHAGRYRHRCATEG
jgi:hypothetical protein